MASSSKEGPVTYCKNCKRDIASANFTLHVTHCERFLRPCPKCGEPVRKGEEQQHDKEEHSQTPCPYCARPFESTKIEQHQATCTRKPILCDYCELEITADSHVEHVESCGSRTDQCPLCKQYIMKKEMQKHEDSNCTYPPTPSAPGPSGDVDDRPIRPVKSAHRRFVMDEMRRMLDGPTFSDDSGPIARRSPTTPPRRSNRARGSTIGRTQPRVVARAASRAATRATRGTRAPANQTSIERRASRGNAVTRGVQRQGSSQLEEEQVALALQMSLEQQARASPLPPIPTGLLSERTMLPCEFCDQLIPFDAISEHQTVCGDPDASPSDRVDTLRSDVMSIPSTTEELLPCEFCDELVSLDQIIHHQATCDSDRLRSARGSRTEPSRTRPAPRGATRPLNSRTRATAQRNPATATRSLPRRANQTGTANHQPASRRTEPTLEREGTFTISGRSSASSK